MMRLIPSRPSALGYALGTALYVCALVAAFSAAGDAQQMRPLTAGVYSAAQAARGQTLYTAECASCHGKAMEGTIGPPTAGDGFLANYSARPLATLVDKIQKTMPASSPGTLSRAQADYAADARSFLERWIRDSAVNYNDGTATGMPVHPEGKISVSALRALITFLLSQKAG